MECKEVTLINIKYPLKKNRILSIFFYFKINLVFEYIC
jgi:hypothetical protein